MGVVFDKLLSSPLLHTHQVESGVGDPVLTKNGDIAFALVDSEGRLYFRLDGVTYYIAGTATSLSYYTQEDDSYYLQEDGTSKYILG